MHKGREGTHVMKRNSTSDVSEMKTDGKSKGGRQWINNCRRLERKINKLMKHDTSHKVYLNLEPVIQ